MYKEKLWRVYVSSRWKSTLMLGCKDMAEVCWKVQEGENQSIFGEIIVPYYETIVTCRKSCKN